MANETRRVRALTTLYHDARMYRPGDEFDYDGALTGHPDEGMEFVTDESTKDFAAKRQEDIAKAVKKAEGLRAHHAKLVKQSQDKPGQVALAQKVIDADAAAAQAEEEANAMKGDDDLV